MLKRHRQQEILRLVRAHRVHTQEQLAELLLGGGVEATQVTLSRDIRELGLVKTAQGYQELTATAAAVAPDPLEVVSEFVIDIRIARNLVVLKTSPGAASPVAVALDQSRWPEIVGTIAGDDTVLIIAPDDEAAARLRARMV
jgi:transcriptional regulator of arginine metabolism